MDETPGEQRWRDCSAIPNTVAGAPPGAQRTRQHRGACDVLILGAGPAGASCAVWLARLGFAPMLIEAQACVGGLCRSHSYLDGWNAALPGQTGQQTAANLALSLQQAAVPLRLACPVERIARAHGGFRIDSPALAQALSAPYLVLATGVRARGLPQLAAPHPNVLIGPGAHVLAHDFRGQTVAVLGGGDNAFENALYAREHGAARVDLYARHVRAQHHFVRRMPPDHVWLQNPVTVTTDPVRINGQPYDIVLVCYGWDPCIPALDGITLARDARGFVQTDPQTAQTSAPGLYAIGEVAQRQHPCVVTALADGVVAAKAIQRCLEGKSEIPPSIHPPAQIQLAHDRIVDEFLGAPGQGHRAHG